MRHQVACRFFCGFRRPSISPAVLSMAGGGCITLRVCARFAGRHRGVISASGGVGAAIGSHVCRFYWRHAQPGSTCDPQHSRESAGNRRSATVASLFAAFSCGVFMRRFQHHSENPGPALPGKNASVSAFFCRRSSVFPFFRFSLPARLFLSLPSFPFPFPF
jgi:hypothetical protein